jgi:hypothetical protein
VLNPLAFHNTKEKRLDVFHKYENALSSNQLDVMLKYQYTIEFLRVAEEARAKHLAWCGEIIDSLEKELKVSRETQSNNSFNRSAS